MATQDGDNDRLVLVYHSWSGLKIPINKSKLATCHIINPWMILV